MNREQPRGVYQENVSQQNPALELLHLLTKNYKKYLPSLSQAAWLIYQWLLSPFVFRMNFEKFADVDLNLRFPTIKYF